MSFGEIAVLLLLVVDPFGNLPFVLSVLGQLSPGDYRRAIAREMLLAFLILLLFALTGDRILHFLHIDQSTLSVAGGVILFLISLKMIFRGSGDMFDSEYKNNPVLVPIAIPAVAGPSAIATVIILHTREAFPSSTILAALAIVFFITYLVFLFGAPLSRFLGPRGVKAMEKFMGLLLNLVAVNMILNGIRDFLLIGA